MATLFSSAHFWLFYFLFPCFLILLFNPIFISSTQTFPDINPNFDLEFSLFGDAKIVNGGSFVKLTNPSASSSGLLMNTKPIKFLEPKSRKPTSFSADFSFSISPDNGDGIAFLIVPYGFSSNFSGGKGPFGLSRENRFLGIEFDTSMDGDVGDLNANHVGIDVGSLVSARVSNVSSVNLVLNSGAKLRSWIDYDASSKRLEVRLSEFGNGRPYDPLLAYLIDFSEMWKDEEVFVCLSSSNGNSLQTSSVYSWRFRVREVPNWMHSQPVNPKVYTKEPKKSFCALRILAGVIFTTGCGTLVAFVVLFLWAFFVDKYKVIADEYVASRPMNFRYEKVNVVVENNVEVEDVKK